MRTPSLIEVIEAALRTHADRINTGIPAKVTAYNLADNTVNVEIVTKQPFYDENGAPVYDTLPSLPSVPVIWPRAGGYKVLLPIAAGDYVWLLFSQTSLAEWRGTGQVSEPVDTRRLSMGYPFAIPGAFPDSSPLSPADAAELAAGAMIIGKDGADPQIIFGGTVPGIRLGKTAAAPVALAPPLDAWIAEVCAAFTGDSVSNTALAAAMTALAAAMTALAAIPALAPAAAQCTASATAATASAAAATAAVITETPPTVPPVIDSLLVTSE